MTRVGAWVALETDEVDAIPGPSSSFCCPFMMRAGAEVSLPRNGSEILCYKNRSPLQREVYFYLHAGKGCIWLGIKMEIYFPKISFVDSKCSNLKALWSNTPRPRCHTILRSTVGSPFLCMQEKGNSAYGYLLKWKFTFQQTVL